MSGCFCTGICKVPPYTCSGKVESVTISGSSTPTANYYPYDLELQSLRSMINSQEHTINHTQKGIEKCFERVEMLEGTLRSAIDEWNKEEKLMNEKFTWFRRERDLGLEKINKLENTIVHLTEMYKHLSITHAKLIDDELKTKLTVKSQNPFEFVAVDAKRRDDIRHVKEVLYTLYCWLLDNIQDNKERSTGIEHLEAAAMWLNKAISRRKDNGIQT